MTRTNWNLKWYKNMWAETPDWDDEQLHHTMRDFEEE